MVPPPFGAGHGSHDVLHLFPIGAFAETPPLQESTVVAEEQQTDETETDSGQTDASSPDPGVDTEEASEEFPAEDAESMIEPPAQKVAQEPAEKTSLTPLTVKSSTRICRIRPQAPTLAATVCRCDR